MRSDSVAALRMVAKMSSSSPSLNAIAAELSLSLELNQVEEVMEAHLPGALNKVADALSRLAEPGSGGELPEELRGAKRRQALA